MTGHRALEKKQITQGNNRKVQNPSESRRIKGLAQKPRLRTSKPCQNMLWQGLFSLQNDFWVTPPFLHIS